MTRRDTRNRIVHATRQLHEEVGPAETTITAIAERAGVQRLTVYRHFPDEAALIGACSADWSRDHPVPDPSDWGGIRNPEHRLRAALAALYPYFRSGAPMLGKVLRDESAIPELAQAMIPWWRYMGEVAGGLAAGWAVGSGGQRLVRASVGHAVDFFTWRSLRDRGLTDEESVEMMAGFVSGVAERAAD